MPEMQVNLIKGDKISSLTDYRDALPVNMYAVQREILGANGYMLCWPGLTEFGTSQGVARGGVFNDRVSEHFRVSGNQLVAVDTQGVETSLGPIPGSDQAAMPYSYNTQCIIANGTMFLYDKVSGLRQVTDPDLGKPIDGVWIDGYYFLTDGEYIYHTDITDESSIDPLKYATAEFMPDKSLAVGKTQDDKVIVFGRHSIEYFVDAATPQFAFRRLETRAQSIGLVATHAKAASEGTWYITGSRRNEALGVYMVGVGSSTKVSTREIDHLLEAYSDNDLTDMRMETLVDKGSVFILVHLPNETLCLNVTIAKAFGIGAAWLILKSRANNWPYRAINGVLDPRLNKWVYGDKYEDRLGLLDASVFTQYNELSEWLMYTPFINLETFSIDELSLETIPGDTVANDATVAVSITLDGLNYGTEWWNLYGAPLDYGKQFIIRRMGHVSNWVGFRFRGQTSSRMAFAGLKITYG